MVLNGGDKAPSTENSSGKTFRAVAGETLTAAHYIRLAMIVIALTLPTLSLVIFGSKGLSLSFR